jgi:hypothetical protein
MVGDHDEKTSKPNTNSKTTQPKKQKASITANPRMEDSYAGWLCRTVFLNAV